MWVIEAKRHWYPFSGSRKIVNDKFFVKGPSMDGFITIDKFGRELVITKETYIAEAEKLEEGGFDSWEVRPATEEDILEFEGQINSVILHHLQIVKSSKNVLSYLTKRKKLIKEAVAV